MAFELDDHEGIVDQWLVAHPDEAEAYQDWIERWCSDPYQIPYDLVQEVMIDCMLLDFAMPGDRISHRWVFTIFLDAAGFGELINIRPAVPLDQVQA